MPESFALRERMPYVSAFLSIIVLVLLIEFLGFFKAIDWPAYDTFLRIRGSREPSKKIVIAEIDEKTLSTLGRWPIPRRYYADLLEKLELADVVGFDIIMAEPTDDDERFAASIRKFGKVVLAAYLDPHGHIIYPVVTLGSPRIGHAHVEIDADGIARNIYHGLRFNDIYLQSFASAIYNLNSTSARRFTGDTSELCTSEIIQSDPMTVNFYGRSGTFRKVPFSDILNGKWPREFFRGKTVLVGVTVQGIEAGLLTPFTTERDRMPGVEFHANVLGNLLDNSFIRPVSEWSLNIGMIIVAAFFFVLFARSQAMPAFFLFATSMLVLTILIYILLVRANIWIPPGSLWASIVAPFLVCSTLELKRTYRSFVQARKNWEEAFDTIDDGIYIQNCEGDFVRTNNAGRLMMGDFLLQAMKKSCTALARRNGGMESQPGTNATNEPVQVEELFDPATSRHYEIKSLRRDVGGKFGGFVHVVRDITLKKQAQEEQLRLQGMLIQAQKMESLGTLASGIAHDFNNILTAVFGYTELILHGLPAGEKSIRVKLEQVLKASNRAKELIAQILTFSRRTVTKRSGTRIAPVLKDAVKLFKTGVPGSITVAENFEADCETEIDLTQIHQVILNLCTNAYHALRKTGGTIQVSLTMARLEHPLYKYGQELRPGDYVKLTVSDNGSGIPEEHREKIFEPYFTTKAEGEGTGLGLAIVQAIAQEHGGVATFESEAGKGTSFHIYLPKVASPMEIADAGESDETIKIGSGHILLVEDDPQNCTMVQEMLEGFGYTVESRTNPREALDLFRSRAGSFDLVITDFDMPLMSGIDLAEKLLEVRPDFPVLLCTGYCDQSLSQRAQSAGIRNVIRKPFDSGKLSRIIAALIAR